MTGNRRYRHQPHFCILLLGCLLAAIPGAGLIAQPEGTGVQFSEANLSLPADESLGFVSIPAGQFPMGSNPLIDPMAFENERWSASQRQGRVDMPQYYIARYETTVAQFRAFVEATGYPVDPQALTQPDNYPVSFVSWTDALAYARWLDGALRTIPQLPVELKKFLDDGARVTLPNEAEWEKAAKGEQSRIYPWGNQFVSGKANVNSSTPQAVGSVQCSDCVYGLSDMSGNVWEWTRSPYREYPFDTDLTGVDLADDALWTMRGGSFSDENNNARAAVRGAADPGARRAFIGFRVVLSKD
ncbi:MAG: SUMF1/EgtB/PvdO family nonheme iron enzyme [Gammaproteobacteria bacterium]